jgi:MFS family permease
MLSPKQTLSEPEVSRGLRLVIIEGLATEVMTSFTGGAFLVAMALLLGADNVQIGMMAALPTFTNLFQLLSIFLVRKFRNRRAIAVLCAICARLPLLVIGLMALFSDSPPAVQTLIFFLFFYYLFGSIAGPTWNAWMKDLVPEKSLGTYFAKRSSYTQMLNVVISLTLAFTVDYFKSHYKELELSVYASMFFIGGFFGIMGALILSRVPEPLSQMKDENIWSLFRQPLMDKNFRRLLLFNSGWVFALNIATPFFTVFMLKELNLSLSYIIGLGILNQIASILTIRTWGAFADRYSNKTIIAISAPFYIMCIIAWCFVGLYPGFYKNLLLLALIHIGTGMSTAGVNISVANIGLKLSPSKSAIVYLSTKNIITSFFASIAPMVGGQLADFFQNRSLVIDATWTSKGVDQVLHILSLHQWNFLFAIGGVLALLALELLVQVKEVGEVDKDMVVRVMRQTLRTHIKDFFIIETLIGWHDHLWAIIRKRLKFNLGDKRSTEVT